MDFPLIAQAASLRSRIPFLHYFDGFRTSHELSKVAQLEVDEMKQMIDDNLIYEHRARALSLNGPLSEEQPKTRMSSSRPERDVIRFMRHVEITEQVMEQFKEVTGRKYQLFQYEGDPEAEHIIILMGSGCETVQETVEYLDKEG